MSVTMAVEGDTDGINFSNQSFVWVMQGLGFESVPAMGVLHPDVLIERLECPLAEDAAVPTVKVGNVVFCGRDREYFEMRRAELRNLCAKAIVQGKSVVWG